MRQHKILALVGATALGVTGVASTASAQSVQSGQAATSSVAATSASGAQSYVVLTERGGSAKALAAKLEAKGATVTSVNEQVGLVTVMSTDAGFAKKARAVKGVFGASTELSLIHI